MFYCFFALFVREVHCKTLSKGLHYRYAGLFSMPNRYLGANGFVIKMLLLILWKAI